MELRYEPAERDAAAHDQRRGHLAVGLQTPERSPTTVHFSDPASGWVLGGDDAEMLGWVATSTTDGGRTWTTPSALPLDDVANIDYSVYEAFAPQGGALAVFMETDALIGGIGDATTVWRTTDGGATWAVAGKLPDAGISDMAFSSPTVGWAAGAWLWHTTDGGTSWHKVRQAPRQARIVVVGDSVWVIGATSSLHSSDSGATWTSSKVSGSAAAFADASHGWVAAAPTTSVRPTGAPCGITSRTLRCRASAASAPCLAARCGESRAASSCRRTGACTGG